MRQWISVQSDSSVTVVVTSMSSTRSIRAKAAFWLAVAGAVLALPIAVITSCQVRGEYVPGPNVQWPMVPALDYAANSILIGLAVGLPLTAALIVAAVFLWRKARRGDGPRPGADRHGFTPDPRS
jgi:hypothetical protein